MSTRRDFIGQTTAAGILSITGACAGTIQNEVAPTESPARLKRRMSPRIKEVIRRDETIVRYGGVGDNWHMSWGADDRQYVSLCDGAGFSDSPRAYYNSRLLTIAGGPRDARFADVPEYPILAAPTQRRDEPRYYNFGTLALDGHLYQFLSTFNRQSRLDEFTRPDFNNLMRFSGAKLIYSPDNGRTWHNQDGSTPVVWETWADRSRRTMVFFEEENEAFSLISVLQMGRNYQFNRDGYLYVYSPNGNTDRTMNELVMFRVPKARLLDRHAYEYFAGRTVSGSAIWSNDIRARKPIHTFPRGWVNKLLHPYAWHPSVVYNEPLGVYMMANWGMGTGKTVDGFSGTAANDLWFAKPSYLGFWIAADPWGPWTQIYEETAWMPSGDASARAYQPQIAPKWIAPDGKSFWLVWTDFQITDTEAMKRLSEKRKKKADVNGYSDADVLDINAAMRAHMPYYRFNVQRVDITLG